MSDDDDLLVLNFSKFLSELEDFRFAEDRVLSFLSYEFESASVVLEDAV